MKPAVVCVGVAGINALATVRSLGKHDVPVHVFLRHLAKAPQRALEAATWRPYLRRKQWAVFALDDLAPWRKSMRQLANWLFRARSFGRTLGRLAARRA